MTKKFSSTKPNRAFTFTVWRPKIIRKPASSPAVRSTNTRAASSKNTKKPVPTKSQTAPRIWSRVRAQTGLIFLAFRNTERIKQLIVDSRANRSRFTILLCPSGVRQTIWRVALTEDFVGGFCGSSGNLHRRRSSPDGKREIGARNVARTKSESHRRGRLQFCRRRNFSRGRFADFGLQPRRQRFERFERRRIFGQSQRKFYRQPKQTKKPDNNTANFVCI